MLWLWLFLTGYVVVGVLYDIGSLFDNSPLQNYSTHGHYNLNPVNKTLYT